MANASVDFILNPQETVDVDFTVTPDVTYQAVLDLSASTRNHDELSNRDLPDQHPISAITNLDETLYGYGHNIDDLLNTVAGYGDIVTHDTDEFATAEQGALADTALQPGDNISELVNDEGYLKAASLNGYATEGYVNAEIGNITDILDSYGNIVTHNVNEFATAQQGQIADTALQSGDNISELTNNVHYATESFVEDKIEDVTDTFGDIVTHNVSEFATSAQGALADTAVQPDDLATVATTGSYSDLTDKPTNYVTTNTTQTISGEKNFTGVVSIPAGMTYITAGNGGAKLGYFTYDIDGYSNITLQTMTASSRDINFKTNNSGKVKYKGKEIAIKEDIPTQASDVNALPDTTTISDLTTTAQLNALNSGATTTNIGQITTNENDISDINDKIPSQASSTNQLADKNFVNSSIATNTANFIGTFNSVAELEAYSGTLTNNDYAFVQTTDTAGNTLYDRYKWNGTQWLFEYELNNSSFTAEQWATINSGATSSDVALAQSALQSGDNVSELVNDAGYITSASLPTVNDATLTIQKNGTSVGTFTANASSNVTANITVPTDTSDLTNGAGYITGITSGDVTTALGYTPYNSTNPSGYITATALNGYATQTWVGQQGYLTSISSSDVTSALGYTPANDSSVVKTTGDQVIADKKRFTGNMQLGNGFQIYAPNLTKGTLPASTVYKAIFTINDSTYNSGGTWQSMRLAVGEMSVDTTGKVDFYFGCYKFSENSSAASLIHCIYDTVNSYRYVTVPAPAGDANGSEAVTASWVNGKLANYVTTNTAQTITSSKTFTAEQKFKSSSNTTTNGLSIAPYTFGGADIGLRDTSNNWLCKLYFNYNGALQLTGTSVTSTTPTEDTTSSIQVDTVGARNTKLQDYATTTYVNSILPTGSILPFGGSSAPTGFLLCDGSAVSRTTYADLYAVIGDTYGSGDGSTTFNVPNLSTAVLPSTSTVNVMGNGNALAIVDDLSTEAKQHNALIVGSGTSSFSSAKVPFAKFELSEPLAIGSQASSVQEFGTVRKALGVSTLPEWSGLTGSITGVSVNYIIKV